MTFTATIQANNSGVSGTTGEYQHRYDVQLLDGSITVDATGAISESVLEVGLHGNVFLELTAPLGAGTSPTLGLTVETSKDGGVNDPWRTVAAFTTISAAQSSPLRKSFPGCDWFIRLNCTTLGGSGGPTWNPTVQGWCY